MILSENSLRLDKRCHNNNKHYRLRSQILILNWDLLTVAGFLTFPDRQVSIFVILFPLRGEIKRSGYK